MNFQLILLRKSLMFRKISGHFQDKKQRTDSKVEIDNL